MKKLLLKMIAGVLLVGVTVFVFISFVIPPQYDEAYHKAVLWQYQRLQSLDGQRKVIVVGSSSLAFGFDMDTMEQLSGLPCQSVGNTVGTGIRYNMEMAIANADEGDIIVIEFLNQYYNRIGTETILTTAENHVDMLAYFSLGDIPQLLAAFPGYISSKMDYFMFEPYTAEGTYSAAAFDRRGQMTIYRDRSSIARGYDEKEHGTATWKIDFDPAFISYLNDFYGRAQNKGITVLMTNRPTLDIAVRSNPDEIQAYEDWLHQNMDIPLISTASEYFFPVELMYDSIYHCNTEGAKVRTKLLYEDIISYLGEL